MKASSSRKRSRSSEELSSSYVGYTFPSEAPPSLDRVDPSLTSPQAFYEDYIACRKPCILTNHCLLPETATTTLSGEQLQQVAGQVRVQVERRVELDASFGQNRTTDAQVVMTISELFDLWKKDPKHQALFYLSTQEKDHDDEDNTNDPFYGPCRALINHGLLPTSLPLAGNLQLESCNLWMGMAQGSSSGLHHDFHDNFYLLTNGQKQFRLYAPSEVAVMGTFGELHQLYENGLISYRSEPLRSDGVPLRMVDEHGKNSHGEDEEDVESEDDEDSVVLGKGFDYKSSNDDEENDGDALAESGLDDFDQVAHSAEETKTGNEKHQEEVQHVRRPDSFSAIDPTLPKQSIQRLHPDFGTATECIVDIKAGEALYLPASWFHCVTSSTGPDKLHMAINFWYYPPNQLDNFDMPYAENLWKNQRPDLQASTEKKRSAG